VHPTPIYELIVGLAIAWWLWRRGSKRLATGEVVGEYLLLTGIARFLVEFIRRNPKILLGLSNAQLASLGSVAAGAILIWIASARRKPAPEDPAELAKVT
jgi:phosphatidylglycerol---prolipoprotein diacylglyceryl transferase